MSDPDSTELVEKDIMWVSLSVGIAGVLLITLLLMAMIFRYCTISEKSTHKETNCVDSDPDTDLNGRSSQAKSSSFASLPREGACGGCEEIEVREKYHDMPEHLINDGNYDGSGDVKERENYRTGACDQSVKGQKVVLVV